jgi:glutamine synthetase
VYNKNVTKSQIKKIIAQEKVCFILLQFSDFHGQPKSVTADISRLDDILKNGNWFDGSSIEGFARIAESDMLLKPDLNTFALIPWSHPKRKSARLICNIFKPSGRRLPADPRQTLIKVLDQAKAMGFDYYVGAEFEFYLFEREALPNLIPHDDKSYFDFATYSRASDICEQTMLSLNSFGIKGEMHHHEVGSGQHEIDIRYDQALKSADNIHSLKMALKAYSSNSELKVSWMPKPIFASAGNGLHVHQSLWKNGKNKFYDPKNNYSLSKLALQFLSGQLAHAPAISALASPTINSYKRLVSGYEAPVFICWAQTNRSALIRIPRISASEVASSTRMEYRAPDPSSNPYLTFAALLAAGLDGIKNKLTPPDPVEENVYHFTPQKLETSHIDLLPDNLNSALQALETDKVISNILGSAKDRYLQIKKTEWQNFLTHVSSWEIDKYL